MALLVYGREFRRWPLLVLIRAILRLVPLKL
mgnify:CR=1 FL=1